MNTAAKHEHHYQLEMHSHKERHICYVYLQLPISF